ncbi:ABC transporter ATP-binding protein [Stetteria hydrogenophila]
MVEIQLRGVTKRFGRTVAVDHVDLTIPRGSIFTLLGPSGCGKTTTLRIIAGLEYPDEGSVLFEGEDVTWKKPYERNTAMVFQNYALWPHMTVYENVAFGLRVRGLPRSEVDRRVRQALSLVGLEGLEDRYPSQLSGGQQQRVALARALVVEPRVLLLDEPLSNLDAKLRLRMREEIVRLQRRLGITTVYVTHDQEEAMSLSDYIAVMNRGRVLQVGTPREVYSNPVNLFVATFIGRSTHLKGRVVGEEGGYVVVDAGGVRVRARMAPGRRLGRGEHAVVVMRPEDFTLEPESPGDNVFEGVVEVAMFLGSHVQVTLRLPGGQAVKPYLDPDEDVKPGQRLRVYISPGSAIAYPHPGWEDEEALLD